MSSRSKSGLMLVDDPKKFFNSFCELKDKTFTAEDYLPVLGALSKKGAIRPKTRDTYFYTATIFKLITKIKQGSHKYQLSPICKKICKVLNDVSKKPQYQKYLRVLLLNNREKGPIFKRFIHFTSEPKKMMEIEEEFGRFPTKTLISFCKEAGLSVQYSDYVKSTEIKSSVSTGEFYYSLVKTYTNLQKYHNRNLKLIYISIDLIRDMVCLDLGLESYDIFNSLFSEVMESKKGSSIFLHGAPPQAEDHFEGLHFRNKRYAYISIRINKKQRNND